MTEVVAKRAAQYGIAHLSAIRADMDGEDYSDEMRDDMDIAIAMLEIAAVTPAVYRRAWALIKTERARSNTDD